MRALVLAAPLALSLVALPAQAQRAFSLEGGFITAFEDAAYIVGVRATAAKPGSAGVDFSVSTLPQGIVEGVFILLPNLDVTFAGSVGPRAWLMPRFGASALVGVGEGGGGGVFGLNAGIGLLGKLSEKTGARADVTYTRYFGDGDSVGFTAFTVGFAWMR